MLTRLWWCVCLRLSQRLSPESIELAAVSDEGGLQGLPAARADIFDGLHHVKPRGNPAKNHVLAWIEGLGFSVKGLEFSV